MIIICFILVVLAGAISVIEFSIMNKLNGKFFARYDKPTFVRYLTFQDVSGYDYKIVHFESGKSLLTGYLFGREKSHGLIVVAHGLQGGAETYLPQITYFIDKGWSVFAYDCTGSFNSEGKNTVGLAQSALDLNSALHFIRNTPEISNLPIMLYGHSWGSYAVTSILNQDNDIKASVSLSGYNSPDELITHILTQLTRKSWLRIFAKISRPFSYIFNRKIFGKNAALTAVGGINKSNIPVMIIHGTKDNIIDINGPSIIAKKEQMTNRKVVYEITTNGHFDVFRTENASEYMKTLDVEYEQLKNRYNGNIPYDAQSEYYSKIDKKKYCELNMNLMNKIHDFYLNNC